MYVPQFYAVKYYIKNKKESVQQLFLHDPGDGTCKNGTLPKSRMVVRGGRTYLVSANYEKDLTPTYHHMRIRCLTTTSLTKMMMSHNMFNCSVISFFEMKMDSLS